MRLYSITLFARYCSSSFSGRRLSKLSKYITRFPLFAPYPMRTKSLSIVQIYVPTFILTYSIGNVVRIKMPLKYGIHIQFASYCNCTSVVTPFGIFMFHRCFFVYTRYFVRACMERDKCSLPKAIMTLQFFQLMLCYCLLPSQFPPRQWPEKCRAALE